MATKTRPSAGPPRAAILVPRRSDDGWRDRLWAWCRAEWERRLPTVPIFEGHHTEGMFNRSAAVNRAAALAGAWDVAIIVDSDVVIDAAQVLEAVAVAHRTGSMVLPHDMRLDISRPGVERVLAGYRGDWMRWVRRRYPNMVSAVVAVPRRLWDEVGGFDEQFRGWGYEDTAFAAACDTYGGIVRLPGVVWHLWHPTATEGKPGTPAWEQNSSRGQRYRAATGDRAAIAAIRAESLTEPATDGIPRILHRVVPEHTSAQVEAWWAEFRALHPGWRMMTHRDPLDPSEWPLTARHWPRVQSGAQLAGLVRLEALWRHGGIYMDSDMQPVRALDPLLPLHAFAAWEDERTVPDAVLGARPGHPAIRAAIDLATRRVSKGAWASGPGVITKIMPGRPDVLVLPPETFYPVHYRDARAGLPAFDKAAHPATFAVHHWHGSWLPVEDRWNEAVA